MAGDSTTKSNHKEVFTLSASRHFSGWLDSIGGSLSFTTYQGGKVFFLGLRPNGVLSVFERSFPRCMGMVVSNDQRTIMMATKSRIYRLDNILPEGSQQEGYDALYAPHQTWITGDIDIHDVGLNTDGLPIFASTLYNCIATVSEGYSFRPLWKPPFISRLAAEDRCHLNGLAMENGKPRYVTCVSRSDATDGWRDRRNDGGVVVDVLANEVVASNLSMPHSPRLRDGKLWLLNSGTGELGWIDPDSGKFNAVAFCPGFARGLAFIGNYAVVGLSRARQNRTFQGLPLDSALKNRDVNARCGLLVIDLRSGDIIEWVRIEGLIGELYDVAALPGVRCPSAIGLSGRAIQHIVSIDKGFLSSGDHPADITGQDA